MAMTALSTLLLRVVPYARAENDGERLQLLSQGARDFCRKTWAWGETMSGVALVAGQLEYTVTIPAGYLADVLAVDSVQRKTSAGVLARTYLKSEYVVKPDNKIEFAVAPLATGATTTDTLTLGLVWLPTEAVLSLPDWLMDRWGEAFRHYAIAQLLEMHGTSRAHEQSRQRHQSDYDALVASAKAERFSGRQSGPQTLTIPEFV